MAISVKLKHKDESFHVLLKRFKNKTYKAGIIKEAWERKYYKKPSKKRHERKKLVEFAKKINNYKILL